MRKNDEITAIVKITNNCNLRCPYCYLADTLNDKKEMSMEVFKKAVIKLCLKTKNIHFIFHGGEPLIVGHEKLEEMIIQAETISKTLGAKIRFGLQTNLTKVDKRFVDIFKKYKIGVGFSYDGYFNNETRGNDEIIIKNFNLLTTSGLQTSCISLLTNDNIKNAIKHEMFMEILGINYRFNSCFSTKDGNELTVDKTNLKAYKDYIDYIFDKEDSKGIMTFNGELKYLISGEKATCENINCTGKWVGISPNGDISPCGQTWNWRKNKYVFGNIVDVDFSKYMEDEIYSTFKKKVENVLKNDCDGCEILDFCNGGCPAKSYNNNGDVGIVIKSDCDHKKEIFNYIKIKIKNGDFKNKHIIDMITESEQNGTKRL